MKALSLGNLKMPAKKQPVTKPSSKKNLANRPHDALDTKVALEAKFEQNGISIGARSRAIAAFDRLVGGLIDWLAAYPKGKGREAQARAEGREALIRAQDAAALRLFEQDDELGRVRLQKFLRDEYRKQNNHFEVASYALEDLLTASPSLPAQSDTAQASSSDDPPAIDEDWMNLFSDYAARASSDRLREQWGRILAGEIRKPGAFSFTTLRVIAEMNGDLARAFQDLYRLSVGGIFPRPPEIKNDFFKDVTQLEAAGLIQMDMFFRKTIGTQADGFAYLIDKEFLLRVTFMPGQTEIALPIIQITQVGQEIGTFLPRDECEALRHMSSYLREAKKVELCALKSLEGSSINFSILELLHEKS
jgi:hypothetical protein